VIGAVEPGETTHCNAIDEAKFAVGFRFAVTPARVAPANTERMFTVVADEFEAMIVNAITIRDVAEIGVNVVLQIAVPSVINGVVLS
jgi:hypothetical protein